MVLIKQYIRKGTSLKNYPHGYLDIVTLMLNTNPIDVLSEHTPNNMLHIESC